MGDGAANRGQVYEAFNMAALWELPVLYIIENNGYGMGTSVSRACAGDLSKRGEPYGIEGMSINGMDIQEVLDTSAYALDKIRSGGPPLLIEMKTYRYRGHSMSDPAKYRPDGELKSVQENNDPLAIILDRMAAAGIAEDDIKKKNKEVKEAVKDAVTYTDNSPEPDLAELYTDVEVQS